MTSAEEAKSLLEKYRAKKKGDQTPKVAPLPQDPPSMKTTPESSPALMDAEIGGFKFTCRIDSDADVIAISENIVNFLGDKGVFLPSIRPTKKKSLKTVDGRPFHSPGMVDISPTLQTVAGPCCLRNIRAHIMPDEDTVIRPGTDCPGEVVLGNPFLVLSGLDVKDFVTKHIDKLASIDYESVNAEDTPATIGKLGSRILSQDCASHDSRVSSLFIDGEYLLNDGDDIDYKDVKIGRQEEDDLYSAISEMIKRGTKNLPQNLRPILQALVSEFKDIFRTHLGADPPVDVPPMVIELEDEERPVKVRQRTYSPTQLDFLKKKVEELVDIGCVYRNNAFKWTCAPLIVPKEGKEGFRFTVDLRPINAQTKRTSGLCLTLTR